MKYYIYIGASVLCAVVAWLLLRVHDAPEARVATAENKSAAVHVDSKSDGVLVRGAPPYLIAADAAYGSSVSAEHDFWRYANAMRASTDPAKLMEARHAVLECKGLAALAPEMANFVSGGKSRLEGAVTPERQLAFSDLTSKCTGFRAASKSDIQSLKDDLNAQAAKIAPVQFHATSVGKFSGKEKVEMIFSGSSSELAQVLPQIAHDWATNQGITDPHDERRDDMLTASFLAACDLGTDCSPTGFETEFQCVLNGECQRFWQGIEDGFSDERRKNVAGYRSQLVQAVKTRNLAILGLDASRMISERPVSRPATLHD